MQKDQETEKQSLVGQTRLSIEKTIVEPNASAVVPLLSKESPPHTNWGEPQGQQNNC